VTRGVQIALTNVISPDDEPEFAMWYDDVHIPATLKLPGFVRASRYRLAAKQIAPALADQLGYQYLVIYDVDVDRLDDARGGLAAVVASTPGFSSKKMAADVRVAAFQLMSEINRT
jgi:hypothetical protein